MVRNKNLKGGAGIVAVLVMIIIVSVGSALMIVTGRSSIGANEYISSPMPEGYDDNVPTDSETTGSEQQPTITEDPLYPAVTKSMLPQVANTYESINLKDATFTSAVLVDAETNEILAGIKYNKKTYPASLTKLLTLLVAAENIKDLNDTYTFTDKDIDPLVEENASRAGFEAGEKVTMEDLLYAAITVSGGDGTLGLANAVAGSEKEFVKMMNDKLVQLGLSDTNFVNASGLHDKQHYSTAQDIAAITKACLDNDICRKVLSADTYTTSKTKQHPEGIELNSILHSRFKGYFVDIDQDGSSDAELIGGKTGFTDEAMYTLVTVISVDGHEYICVTIKSKTADRSTLDAIEVYENYLPGAVGTPQPEESKSEDDSSSGERTVLDISDNEKVSSREPESSQADDSSKSGEDYEA